MSTFRVVSLILEDENRIYECNTTRHHNNITYTMYFDIEANKVRIKNNIDKTILPPNANILSSYKWTEI